MFLLVIYYRILTYQALEAVMILVAPDSCLGHGTNTTSPALVSGQLNVPNVGSGMVSDRHKE